VYIGSADMMHRNLDRRIEALVRLTDPRHLRYIDQIFTLALSDETAAWSLAGDGTWTRHYLSANGSPLDDMQNVLMRQISQRKRTGVAR
jgi:polyphosphate kinase